MSEQQRRYMAINADHDRHYDDGVYDAVVIDTSRILMVGPNSTARSVYWPDNKPNRLGEPRDLFVVVCKCDRVDDARKIADALNQSEKAQ